MIGEILDWLGTDEETVRQYERREMQIHDEITRITGAKEEGMKLGIQQGIQQNILTMTRNMLLNNIDIQTIRNITGLSIQEIEEIKSRLN